jgi:hypothetical protein
MKVTMAPCVALVLAVAGAPLARAERPPITVAPLEGAPATADVRERMTRAMSEGLASAGADVVPAASGRAECALRGKLEISAQNYDWAIDLRDIKAGTVLQSRADRCEGCSENEALEMAGVSAAALAAQLFAERDGVRRQVRLDAPPATEATLFAVPPAPRRPHAALGWVGIGTGVVAAAAGAWLLSIDGDGTCGRSPAQCENVRDTKAGGWAAIAGGAAAVTVGALMVAGTF